MYLRIIIILCVNYRELIQITHEAIQKWIESLEDEQQKVSS